jgi:hypothetical protein
MLGQMLEEAKEFFEQSLGIRASISLAVLDRSHWLQISNFYGMPWVSWDNVVFLPATID